MQVGRLSVCVIALVYPWCCLTACTANEATWSGGPRHVARDAIDAVSIHRGDGPDPIEVLVNEERPERLLTIEFSPHWGSFEIVDRCVEDGTLRALKRDPWFELASGDEAASPVVVYETTSPDALASYRELRRQLSMSGSFESDRFVSDYYLPAECWHVLDHRTAVRLRPAAYPAEIGDALYYLGEMREDIVEPVGYDENWEEIRGELLPGTRLARYWRPNLALQADGALRLFDALMYEQHCREHGLPFEPGGWRMLEIR